MTSLSLYGDTGKVGLRYLFLNLIRWLIFIKKWRLFLFLYSYCTKSYLFIIIIISKIIKLYYIKHFSYVHILVLLFVYNILVLLFVQKPAGRLFLFLYKWHYSIIIKWVKIFLRQLCEKNKIRKQETMKSFGNKRRLQTADW